MAHGCHRVLEDAAKEIVEPSRDALSHDLVMKEAWGAVSKRSAYNVNLQSE